MRRSSLSLAAAAGALTIVVVFGMLWLSRGQTSPSAAPTAAQQARCLAQPGPLPSVLSSDPCPSAILAVELAAAIVRLPIERITINPGTFTCGLLWPGVRSAPACYEPATQPGQYIHAWVTFAGSEEVAAVLLGLDLPDDLGIPGATRPPWRTTVLAVEVPPTGWVLP